MLGVVVSRADEASVAIGDQLRTLTDWTTHADGHPDGGGVVRRAEGIELREFAGLHLHLDRPAAAFDDPDLLVFVSRHSGETGPLLTAHHTGNVGPADHGGRANEFARACPYAHARVLDRLAAHAPAGYDVGMECTHHGPSDLGAPGMFVEVGSGPEQWADEAAARAVARAVLDLRGVPADAPVTGGHRKQLLGVGGGHYAPRFERVVRETDWAVGHVVADWGLERVDDHGTVLERARERSRAAYALADGDRGLTAALGDRVRVVSETFVRETDGVALPVVAAVEDAVGGVEEGTRFGSAAGAVDPDDPGLVVAEVPAELLERARGIDRAAARDALAVGVAYGTDQSGTRPTGPVVLRTAADREVVVGGLLDVVRTEYDAVEREGKRVRARTAAFDPGLAADLGVPEGPAFGRLANGQSVEVDGETIRPEAVHETREDVFSLEGSVRRASDAGEGS